MASYDTHRALLSERVALQRRESNTEKKKPVVSSPTPIKKRSPSKTPTAKTNSSATTAGGGVKSAPVPKRTAPSSSSSHPQPKKNAAQLEKERQQAMVPCRYFSVNGQCNQGSKCPYSHNPDLLGIFGGGAGSQSRLFGTSGGGEYPVAEVLYAEYVAEEEQHHRGGANRRRGGPVHPSNNGGSSNPAEAFDIDRMDYEQLSALCESMGKVKVGLDKQKLASLPCVTVRTKGTQEKCSVCLEQFEIGEKMKLLPCGHPFHPVCIDEWLEGSKKCPNCNEEIEFGAGKKQQSRPTQSPPPATAGISNTGGASSSSLPPIHTSPQRGNSTTVATATTTNQSSNSNNNGSTNGRPPLVFRNVQDVMAALEDCP